MIDPKLIRENPEKIKKNSMERNVKAEIVESWLELDKKRAVLIKEIDELRAERNSLSDSLKGKPDAKVIEKVKGLKSNLDLLESKLESIDAEWSELLNTIPNIHFPDVPIGKDDSQNVVLGLHGKKPEFNFEPKDHLTLGKALGILDFEAGAKVSGSQFYYLKNDGVLLEFALIQYGLRKFVEKGFELFMTPDLAKSRFYLGTGYAPRGDEAQTYEIKDEDLGLIATAEVTMAGYHADEIFKASDLPKKYVAISHCYRKEAGAYGKYSKGLYRVHQFSKMEMFAYCTEEQSNEMHKLFLEIEKEIADELGLHYRVIHMCSGDLGGMAARKYDLEAWLPGRNDFGEITSTSNCTDYQARNLNIRYKDENGENKFAHMLNGTAIVLSRFPIAIMENYQQADGSILIPEVLRPFIGKDRISQKM